MYKKMYPVMSVYDVLPQIKENDVVVLRDRQSLKDEFRGLAKKHKRKPAVVAAGTLGHRDCIAVRLLPE